MTPAGHINDALQYTSKAQFMSDAKLCQAQMMPEVIAQARYRAWFCCVQHLLFIPAESIPCSCGSLPRPVTVLCQQQQSEVCSELDV